MATRITKDYIKDRAKGTATGFAATGICLFGTIVMFGTSIMEATDAIWATGKYFVQEISDGLDEMVENNEMSYVWK